MGESLFWRVNRQEVLVEKGWMKGESPFLRVNETLRSLFTHPFTLFEAGSSSRVNLLSRSSFTLREGWITLQKGWTYSPLRVNQPQKGWMEGWIGNRGFRSTLRKVIHPLFDLFQLRLLDDSPFRRAIHPFWRVYLLSRSSFTLQKGWMKVRIIHLADFFNETPWVLTIGESQKLFWPYFGPISGRFILRQST